MTFERRHQRLATARRFCLRSLKFAVVSIMMVVVSLWFGAWGYEEFAGLSSIDAWHAAAMILFSEGPVARMATTSAKLWEIVYSAYSGVAFITAIATFLAPVAHRIYHRFHIDIVEE